MQTVVMHHRTPDPARAARSGGIFRRLPWWERGVIPSRGQRRTPPTIARVLLWTVKLATIAVLLYAAFWIALVVIGALAVATLLARSGFAVGEPEWDVDDHPDHRERLFYHPQGHNDDPDPRWQYSDSHRTG